MADMEARLRDMLDHHEIQQVLCAYCHACDRADEAMMAACYTGEDSFDDHGLVRAPGPEYARMPSGTYSANRRIKVTGDLAAAETFFLGFMRLKPQDGVSRLNQLAGRFVDQLERIDGEWKIRHRTCVRDTSITLRVDEDMQASYGLAAGSRDAADPGAALLGPAHHE